MKMAIIKRGFDHNPANLYHEAVQCGDAVTSCMPLVALRELAATDCWLNIAKDGNYTMAIVDHPTMHRFSLKFTAETIMVKTA